MKNDLAFSHIPIILLTALSEDSQRIYGIAEGADEYIPKPFNIDFLKIRIINMISERMHPHNRKLNNPSRLKKEKQLSAQEM
nr:response regulator [Bacteroides fragilis]